MNNLSFSLTSTSIFVFNFFCTFITLKQYNRTFHKHFFQQTEFVCLWNFTPAKFRKNCTVLLLPKLWRSFCSSSSPLYCAKHPLTVKHIEGLQEYKNGSTPFLTGQGWPKVGYFLDRVVFYYKRKFCCIKWLPIIM